MPWDQVVNARIAMGIGAVLIITGVVMMNGFFVLGGGVLVAAGLYA